MKYLKILAIPKFSKPNPSKSTKISAVQSNIQTNTNSLQNSNSYAVGGGGGGSDS